MKILSDREHRLDVAGLPRVWSGRFNECGEQRLSAIAAWSCGFLSTKPRLERTLRCLPIRRGTPPYDRCGLLTEGGTYQAPSGAVRPECSHAREATRRLVVPPIAESVAPEATTYTPADAGTVCGPRKSGPSSSRSSGGNQPIARGYGPLGGRSRRAGPSRPRARANVGPNGGRRSRGRAVAHRSSTCPVAAPSRAVASPDPASPRSLAWRTFGSSNRPPLVAQPLPPAGRGCLYPASMPMDSGLFSALVGAIVGGAIAVVGGVQRWRPARDGKVLAETGLHQERDRPTHRRVGAPDPGPNHETGAAPPGGLGRPGAVGAGSGSRTASTGAVIVAQTRRSYCALDLDGFLGKPEVDRPDTD